MCNYMSRKLRVLTNRTEWLSLLPLLTLATCIQAQITKVFKAKKNGAFDGTNLY